jgi:arabinan endo-1,5-alpha-L-arabinosidase
MKTKIALYLTIVMMTAGLLLTVASAQRRGGPTTMPNLPPGESERLTKQLGSRGVQIHDPSTIVKCKDEYWVFYTGNGVLSYHSKDLITWERGPQAITNRPTWLTDVVPNGGGRGGGGGASFWAPDVIHFGDRYLMYFSFSAFGKNTSAIAMAWNPTLDPNDPNYKWTEEGIVVQSKTEDDFNTIDPGIVQTPDGGLWLCFGSFWSGIKLIQLDPKTGKRIAPDSPMYSLAHTRMIEASDIYFHDGYYYLMLDWGKCCSGITSTYDMRVGRSQKITGPYLDKDGKDMLQGGGSELLGTDGAFIGPGHPGILKEGDKYWMSMHYYDGASGNPRGTLAIRPLTWDKDGWPVVGKLN